MLRIIPVMILMILLKAGCHPAPSSYRVLGNGIHDGGIHDGNGGDPRITKISRARIEAANWVGKVSLYPEELEGSHSPAIAEVLSDSDVLTLLAADILESPHIFPVEEGDDIAGGSHLGEVNRCAWTNDPELPSLDHIRFNLDICERGLTEQGRLFAALILIHESLHHLARRLPELSFASTAAEERFADEAALAIASAFERIAAAGQDYWSDVTIDNGLANRGYHSALWTGSAASSLVRNRMIVWGGCQHSDQAVYGCGSYFDDGAIYDPEEDSWAAIHHDGAPGPRAMHSALWAEDKMIVWGGCTEGDGCTGYLNTGGVYDPILDRWNPTPLAGAPGPRVGQTAIWSGREMIIWGGERREEPAEYHPLADGARYDPEDDTWRDLPPSPLAGRRDHTAIWTGDAMIIWGGCDQIVVWDCRTYFHDGAIYSPETNEWTPISWRGAPAGRRGHTAIWTGSYMIVWGGESHEGVERTGGLYDPASDRWVATSFTGPSARSQHTAVWTGDGMIVFGGESAPDIFAEDMALFVPPIDLDDRRTRSGRWRPIPLEFAPIKIKGHTAVWTGDAMVIWGGQSSPRSFHNNGVIYHPGIDDRL